MGKQFTIQLSDQQRFDTWLFIRATVKPRDQGETNHLVGVWDALGLQEFSDKVADLKEGESVKLRDFAGDAKPIEIGSVDLKTLMGYLDKLGGNVDAETCLRLGKIHDELDRVKNSKPLASVPAEGP